MSYVTYPPHKGHPHMDIGDQKPGPKIRTPRSEGYQQVSGGKKNYPAVNESKGSEYYDDRSKQSPTFARTATAGKDAAPSMVSNSEDYPKKGRYQHKAFARETPGKVIRKGMPKAL